MCAQQQLQAQQAFAVFWASRFILIKLPWHLCKRKRVLQWRRHLTGWGVHKMTSYEKRKSHPAPEAAGWLISYFRLLLVRT